MPTALRVLSWNIKDLNAAQVGDSDFLDLVARVIHHEGAKLVSILETKSNLGSRVGTELATRLTALYGAPSAWSSHSSTGSAPNGNKPENYVFLWDTSVVTGAAGFKFPDDQTPKLGFPNQHSGSRSPSRFPYLGTFVVGGKSFTVVAFHTTFASVDIAESNQTLAAITAVRNDANVIVMGDFNDDPANSRTYRGVSSFQPLVGDLGFVAHITAKTSLCQAFLPTWTTTLECRANIYDNFFVKTAGDLAVVSASVVDVIDALRTPNYLEPLGKRVFNGYATRTNTYENSAVRVAERTRKRREAWTDIPLFGAAENVATIEEAHEIHWVAVSDHLPIVLNMNVT